MIWLEETEIPTTWQEVSTFYRAWLKSVSCSEFDRAERGPICYAQVPQGKEEVPGPGLDFAPLIFQSLFYIHTRKGFIAKSFFNIYFQTPSTILRAPSNNLYIYRDETILSSTFLERDRAAFQVKWTGWSNVV